MGLSNAVNFIYEHGLDIIEPWESSIIKTMTKAELTSSGFMVISSLYPEFWVGMYYFRNTFFVCIHEESGTSYLSAARDQKKACTIYYEIVNALAS